MTPVARLSDVLADVQPGFASGDNLDAGVFQIRMNNLTRAGELTLTERRRINPSQRQVDKCLLAPGDVLFNATNSPELVGKVAHFDGCDEPAVYSNHFLRLRVDARRLDSRYLTRWLRRKFHQGYFSAKSKRWSNQATFGADRLVELEIELPPLEEQRRIASVLDAACDLRAKRREALAKLDLLSQATFFELFGELTIGDRAWPVTELGELIADHQLGLVRGAKDLGNDKDYPYLRMNAISDDGELDLATAKRADATTDEVEKYSLSRGDLLFNTRNSRELVGKTALFRGGSGYLFNNNLLRLRFRDEINPEFLNAAFRTRRFQEELDRRKSGTTSVFAIYFKSLRTISVSIPPRALQDDFEDRVASVRRQAEAGRRHLSMLDGLFASLQQRAFRGEL